MQLLRRAVAVLAMLWASSAWALVDTHSTWWNFATAARYDTVDQACRGLVETATGRVYDYYQNMAGVMPTRSAQCMGHTGTAAPSYVNSVSEDCSGAPGWLQHATYGCYKTVTTCPAPKTDVGGVCTPPACPAKGVVMPGSASAYYKVLNGASDYRVCIGLCVYDGTLAVKDSNGSFVWGPMTSAGGSCTGAGSGGADPAPVSSPPEPLPPGQCPGQVNGLSVVVPCSGPASAPAPSGAASGTTTGSGPASSSGSTTSGTTTCNEGICTTTTTTTTTTTGGTSSGTATTTGSTSQTQSEFCSKNPGSKLCGSGGSGGTGSGSGGGEGSPCEQDPDTVGCMKPGTVETQPLQATVVPLAITPSSGYGPSNGTCPAPQTANLLGHTYSFSWQPFCDMATGIRPVVLALAWVSAAIGFLGLSRKGN